MLILGIESSTEQVGVAIGGHEGVLASSHVARGRRHAETLTPAIDFVRRQADIELSEISAVAVGIGPGLFTGLRVGVSTGKTLAYALGVPMVGVSSLDLLAFGVRFSNRLIGAVIDARRSELFYAFYRQVPGGLQRLTEPEVGTPDDLASSVMAQRTETLLVGDGALRYRDLLKPLTKVEIVEQGMAYPNAGALVQLAHAKAVREEFVQPNEIEPLYLRKPDAEINWVSREGER